MHWMDIHSSHVDIVDFLFFTLHQQISITNDKYKNSVPLLAQPQSKFSSFNLLAQQVEMLITKQMCGKLSKHNPF